MRWKKAAQEEAGVKTSRAFDANSYVEKPVRSDEFINAMSKLGLCWLLVNRKPM